MYIFGNIYWEVMPSNSVQLRGKTDIELKPDELVAGPIVTYESCDHIMERCDPCKRPGTGNAPVGLEVRHLG